MSPLESGVNSRFCSVFNDGGIRNSASLRIGINSQFYSILNEGGIRNSESLRIGVNSRFCSEILNLFVIFKSLLYFLRELLIPNILYRSEDFCTSEQT